MTMMNRDELRGKVERWKGRVREAFGVLTGHKQERAQGVAEQFTGAAREKVGEIKHNSARKIEET